jgi:hypothetical protein
MSRYPFSFLMSCFRLNLQLALHSPDCDSFIITVCIDAFGLYLSVMNLRLKLYQDCLFVFMLKESHSLLLLLLLLFEYTDTYLV